MLWFQNLRKTERGQAIVEMALVLPILIMLIFGIVEFGRILNTYMIVTNLSREGARAGAVGKTDTEIITVVNDNAALADLVLDPTIITNSMPPVSGKRVWGSAVSVKVTCKVDIIAPVIGQIVGDPYIVTSETTMRVEG